MLWREPQIPSSDYAFSVIMIKETGINTQQKVKYPKSFMNSLTQCEKLCGPYPPTFFVVENETKQEAAIGVQNYGHAILPFRQISFPANLNN